LQPTTLGSVSLAGASDTANPHAYVAFSVVPTGLNEYIVVVELDSLNKQADTVVTAKPVANAAIAVEPVSQDSDRLHVCWGTDNRTQYSTVMDGRSLGIASSWTSPFDLNTAAGAPSAHPAIAADRDKVVAAWTVQGTDILTRQRSTDSAYNHWEAALNLTDSTSESADYASVNLGDAVVFAWEQTESSPDHDVIICVDYGDPLNVADNATMSTFPHAVYQRKTVGDTTVPYVHVIWGETPQQNYYEVQYKQCNLDEMGGEQAAGTKPLPIQPELFPCRPNPFTGRTHISYQFPLAGNVLLKVYDASGRVVKDLQNGFQKPGKYTSVWDGNDARGRRVANGIYFYRLDTPGYRKVRKAVLMR
jgi:hypothetical protein